MDKADTNEIKMAKLETNRENECGKVDTNGQNEESV